MNSGDGVGRRKVEKAQGRRDGRQEVRLLPTPIEKRRFISKNRERGLVRYARGDSKPSKNWKVLIDFSPVKLFEFPRARSYLLCSPEIREGE